MLKLHQNDSTKDWILLSKDGKQRIEVHSLMILDKWTSPGKVIKDAKSNSAKLKMVQTTVSAHSLTAIVDYCYGVGFHAIGAQLVKEDKSLVIVQLIALANSEMLELPNPGFSSPHQRLHDNYRLSNCRFEQLSCSLTNYTIKNATKILSHVLKMCMR